MFDDFINLKQVLKEYDYFETFFTHLGLYIVRQGYKMGVVKVCGTIGTVWSDDYWVGIGEKKIYENYSIDIIVPIEFDEINIFFKNLYMLIAVKNGRKRIIKITKNTIKYSKEFDDIGRFNSYVGLIPVSIGGFLGAINKYFDDIIPIRYEIIDNNISFHIITLWKAFVLVMKNCGKYGIMDPTGNVLLPFKYDEIDYTNDYYAYQFRENEERGISPSNRIHGSRLIAVRIGTSWGMVNEEFNEVVPCIYESISISDYDVNKLRLKKRNGVDLLFLSKNGPRIEPLSTVIVKQYSRVEEFENGYAIVQKNGKYGCINDEYKEIIPCIYDEVGPLLHGLFIVSLRDKYGAIDEYGNIKIPLEYSILVDLSLFGPTMLMAVKDNKFGVINKKNNIIIPFEFDLVQAMFGMITVTKDGKKGLYNHKGELVIPIKYDDIAHPSYKSQTYSVCYAGKWGVINKNEEIIIPIEYDGLTQISSGYMYSVCKAGRWGVVNKKGELITTLLYDKIDKDGFGFTCGRLSVCRNGKWGFINRNGREVIECIYDEVYQFFEDNHCEVLFDGTRITIDIYGNTIGC